jgi:hypothetical protein
MAGPYGYVQQWGPPMTVLRPMHQAREALVLLRNPSAPTYEPCPGDGSKRAQPAHSPTGARSRNPGQCASKFNLG